MEGLVLTRIQVNASLYPRSHGVQSSQRPSQTSELPGRTICEDLGELTHKISSKKNVKRSLGGRWKLQFTNFRQCDPPLTAISKQKNDERAQSFVR